MGFCKSDQKSIPVVGFLTRNDCDVLRAKTGLYRQVTHRTIIPPTTVKNFIVSGVCSSCRMGETWMITYIHGLFLLHLCNRASQYSAISNNRKSRLQKPFEPKSF